MTESQAEKIILLLESIDRRLKSVIDDDGGSTLDVMVKARHEEPIPVYIPASYRF